MTVETTRLPGTTGGSAVPRAPFGGSRRLVATTQVRLPGGRQLQTVDVGDLRVRSGDTLVVEVADGAMLAKAETLVERRVVPTNDLARALRLATNEDRDTWGYREKAADDALRAAVRVLRRLRLNVKIVQAFVPLDANKTILHYASEERVDVRRLARELAASIRGRVELRAIGVREGTGIIGGLGPCGGELCCSSFLTSFASVSIRHAKAQGISLNPQRVTGMCGRLKCCLVYEADTYKEMKRYSPRKRNGVYTPDGAGTILDVDTINRRILVRISGGGMESYHVRDVTLVDRPLTPEELEAGGPSREEAILAARRRRRGDTTSSKSSQAASVMTEDYIWDDTESRAEISEKNAVDAPKSTGKKRRRRRGKSGGSGGNSGGGGGESASPKKSASSNKDDGAAKKKRRRGGRGRRGGRSGGGGNRGGNSSGGNSGGGNSGGGNSGGGNSGGD